jgi:hypothetical protein
MHDTHLQTFKLEWCGSAECGKWAAHAVTLVPSLYNLLKPPSKVRQAGLVGIKMWRKALVASLLNEKLPSFYCSCLPQDMVDTLNILPDHKGNYVSIIFLFWALYHTPQPEFPFTHSAIQKIIATQAFKNKTLLE